MCSNFSGEIDDDPVDWGTPIFLDNTNLYQSYNIYIVI